MLAMLGVFALAVFVEGVSKARQSFVKAAKRRRQKLVEQRRRHRRRGSRDGDHDDPDIGDSMTDLDRWKNQVLSNPHFVRGILTCLHGLQALTGYILMLATMTFSVEFLFMTVVGLAFGYVLFFQQLGGPAGGSGSGFGGSDEGSSNDVAGDGSNNNSSTLLPEHLLEDHAHVNVNPCCNFMEDEAKENEPFLPPSRAYQRGAK